MSAASTSSNTEVGDLVTHTRRPQWGIAMLARREPTRRRYQFQDGVLRTFKKGYYHLLEPVSASQAAVATLREDLERKLGWSLDDRAQAHDARDERPVMSFADQAWLFRKMFPDGFQDPDYITSWRSREGRSRLKRLMDPTMAVAQETFQRDRLLERLGVEGPSAVIADLITVLKTTSLASPTHVIKPLSAVSPEHHPQLAKALFEILYGDGELDARFRKWVMALDAKGSVAVTWPMATAVLGLVRPELHVPVALKPFRLQKRSVAPDARLGRHPSPRGYRSAQRVAHKVRDELTNNHSLQPRDLLDVRVFITQTLRPKAVTMLSEMRG